MGLASEDLQHIVNNIFDIQYFFKDKKIFITGGTGFFGKWLVEAFLFLNDCCGNNTSITILSRSPDKFINDYPKLVDNPYISFIKGDISDLSCVTGEYDFIIHAASEVPSSSQDSKDNYSVYRNIVDGARAICELAKRSITSRILYTSSGAAYGVIPASLCLIDESVIGQELFSPHDFYGRAKRDSEIILIESSPCDVVIARCFAFSGPYLPLNGTYAFGNFINDVLHNKNIVINGNGSPVRSYLYAADLVIWLFKLLLKGCNKEIYNVGSEEGISILDLAREIIRVSKIKINVELLDSIKSNNRINKYVPNTNKIRKELGVSQLIPLSLSIEKTINFYS